MPLPEVDAKAPKSEEEREAQRTAEQEKIDKGEELSYPKWI